MPTGGGAWRLMFFMLFVFLVLLLSYFGLVLGYKKYIAAQIQEKDQELTELASQVPKGEQEEFLKFQFQLINLENIINKHILASKALPLLETNTNPQVYYSNADINVEEARIKLQAVALSYEILSQQIQAYQKMPEVIRYQMNSVRRSDDGRVQFDISLFLKPETFK